MVHLRVNDRRELRLNLYRRISLIVVRVIRLAFRALSLIFNLILAAMIVAPDVFTKLLRRFARRQILLDFIELLPEVWRIAIVFCM